MAAVSVNCLISFHSWEIESRSHTFKPRLDQKHFLYFLNYLNFLSRMYYSEDL